MNTSLYERTSFIKVYHNGQRNILFVIQENALYEINLNASLSQFKLRQNRPYVPACAMNMFLSFIYTCRIT